MNYYHLGCLAGALLGSAESAAFAADSANANASAARSLTSGMPKASVPLLSRDASKVEQTITTLVPAVCGSACSSTRSVDGDHTRVAGAGWHLDVFADGSMAEFANEVDNTSLHAQAADVSKAMSPASLEAAGRAYIAKNLSKVVVLQPGDALVPEMVSLRTRGGVRGDGTVLPTLVVANRIVFRREINGVPVLGSGSKVTLTFLNDGTLQSFRYDWPSYSQTGRSQTSAAVGDILNRVQRVVVVRTNSNATASVVVPTTASSSTRVDLGSDMQLERLECGYYDPGVLHRDPNSAVQAGCFYHAVYYAPGPDVSRAGFAGAVPAATQAEPDSRWAEEQLLRGVATSGGSSPPPSAAPKP